MLDVTSYACSYWAWHLLESGEEIFDGGYVHEFLKIHFLDWLEALSWLGRLSNTIGSTIQHLFDCLIACEGIRNRLFGISILARLTDACPTAFSCPSDKQFRMYMANFTWSCGSYAQRVFSRVGIPERRYKRHVATRDNDRQVGT